MSTGHIPDSLDPDFEEYFTLGPIARYAEDLTLMLKVLKQPGSPDLPLDKPVRSFVKIILQFCTYPHTREIMGAKPKI